MKPFAINGYIVVNLDMGRKKPTNKELTQAIIELHNKVDYLSSGNHTLLIDFIEFTKNDEKFKKFLKTKYSENEEQDTKKSK